MLQDVKMALLTIRNIMTLEEASKETYSPDNIIYNTNFTPGQVFWVFFHEVNLQE